MMTMMMLNMIMTMMMMRVMLLMKKTMRLLMIMAMMVKTVMILMMMAWRSSLRSAKHPPLINLSGVCFFI